MRNVPKPRAGMLAPFALTECMDNSFWGRSPAWDPGLKEAHSTWTRIESDQPPSFQGSPCQRRVVAGKAFLPAMGEMRIGRRPRAGGIELSYLLLRQRPADCAEVLAKLCLVAGADDDGGNGRPAGEPVDRHLRHGLARLHGHLFQR